MIEVFHEQGTEAWHAWRAGEAYVDIYGKNHPAIGGIRITATTASVCGGKSPFNTPHNLWAEMVGLRKRADASYAMNRGTALEPQARKAYCAIVGEEYSPICIESETTPWVAASLDGVDLFHTRGVEIKCPMSEKSHAMAMAGVVPEHYQDQIQWQLLASDGQLTQIDYFSYAPQFGDAPPIPVFPNAERQKELLEASEKFRQAVMLRIPLAGSDFEAAAHAYLILNRQIKELEKQQEVFKEKLKTLADGKPASGGGVIVTVSKSEGKPQWEKVANEIAALHGVYAPEMDELKKKFMGKPSSTISVKESAEADKVYAELLAATTTDSETSFVAVAMNEETNAEVPQALPIW